MRYWTKKFNLDKEDFTCVPVWIRLYSIPQAFWNEEVLSIINNALGSYIKTEGITRHKRFTTFSRICVYLDVSRAIPESITLSYEDSEWIQTLDYEFIHFRCKKCHEHGHLFRDYPLVQASKPPPNKAPSNPKGFTHAPKARNSIPKNQRKETLAPQATNTNPFAVLAQDSLVQKKSQPQNDEAIPQEQPEIPAKRIESQTKKQKRDTSPLLLEYTTPNTQNEIEMEEISM